jgi:hypothetical protein
MKATKHAKWTEEQGSRTVRVTMVTSYGLHYIKGSAAPYFSVTANGKENGRDTFGGCCHDLIEQHHPELSDVIALHLSDMDGAPLHAEANGWHWLARACEIPEQYGPSDKTPEEALETFMGHCRIERQRALDIVEELKAIEPVAQAREAWQRICEAMRPRWEREAKACIEAHDLEVYGDTWPPVPKVIEALMPELAE